LARPGPLDGRLRVTIDRLLGTDATLAEAVVTGTIDLRTVRDDSPALRFTPVARAWDQFFRVRVKLAEAGVDEIALLVNARSTYRGGVLRIDGREQWGDLVFSAGSRDGSLLASLALVQGGVPASLRSGITVLILLVLFAAAAAGAVWVAVRPSTLRLAQGRPEQRRGARTSGRTVTANSHGPGPVETGSAPETVRPEPFDASVAVRSEALEGRTQPAAPPWIVLALYFAGAVLWLLVTPPFEAPDEASHFDFVRFVAVNGSLPRDPQQDRSVWYDTEWFQPPLYYVAMSPVAAALDASGAGPLHERNPRSRAYGGREGTNYAHPEPPPAPFTRLLFALRLASLAFGAVTIWLLFRLVAHVSDDARAATLATAGLLLVPQFTAMSAVVNNDGLATMLAAVAAWLIFTANHSPRADHASAGDTRSTDRADRPSISATPPPRAGGAGRGRPARRAGAPAVTRALGAEDGWGCPATGPATAPTRVSAGHQGGGYPRTLLIGLVTGLAIATKLSTVFLGPMMAVALVIRFSRDLRRLLIHGAVFLASLALTCGWVFLRNWMVFGDPLAREFTLRVAAPLQVPKHRVLTDPFFVEQLPAYLYRSFWASFGWMSVEPPHDSWIWTLYLSLTIGLLAALAVFVVRVVLGRVASDTRRVATIALCGMAFNLVAFLWYAGIWSANQARYFYPTLGPALIVMTPAVGAAGNALRRLHPALDRVLYALLYVALAISWLVAFGAAILRFHFGNW
ncbi:MAG: glycosyltransferase family 39 protein, partial [Acidobacteria bacterium]|nr:glycosyltransferase family 39 protein [Acidobacteriota bacterium]